MHVKSTIHAGRPRWSPGRWLVVSDSKTSRCMVENIMIRLGMIPQLRFGALSGIHRERVPSFDSFSDLFSGMEGPMVTGDCQTELMVSCPAG